uniref:Venom serpin 2 n=1 Tax=Lethocerus distinctifemur TaxID=280095 RepID=A0A2K8JLE4_9HEMI|nr:venom serpin 2 [Lethocerus distinctifemur]
MERLLFLFLALPALSTQQCLTVDDSRINQDPNARLALYKGQQQFSLNLLREINSKQRTENIFFSPLSVYNAMLLAYFVAANHTEAQIKKALYLPDSQDKLSIMQAYGLEKYYQKMRNYNSSPSYELSSANRLFVSPEQHIRECMEDLFEDELSRTNFAADPEKATQEINKWVEDQTRNQIKDLLKEGLLTKDTQLVMVNAAYFKGVWKSRFPAEATKKEIFYISNSKNAFVTMMRQKSTFNLLVSEKLGAHVLELPYKGDEVSMLIFIAPFASPNGTSNILRRLTPDVFQNITEQGALIARPVDVSIPKFTFEKELRMVETLEHIGIGDLFQQTADLSALTGKPGLKLDEAIHKAKIKVDEEGTTAAAATAVFNFRSSRPLDPARFICNHPFIYMLFDKVSKTILFAGVFNKPEL